MLHSVSLSGRSGAACGMVIPITALHTAVLGCAWKRWNRKPCTPEARDARCMYLPGQVTLQPIVSRALFAFSCLTEVGRRSLSRVARLSDLQSAAIAPAHSEFLLGTVRDGEQRRPVVTRVNRPHACSTRDRVSVSLNRDWKSVGGSGLIQPFSSTIIPSLFHPSYSFVIY